MSAGPRDTQTTEPELSLFLLEDFDAPRPRWIAFIGLASVLVNVLLLLAITGLGRMEGTPPKPPLRPVEIAKSTPLIFPRELTQKEPNKAKVAKELLLDDLTAKPEVKAQKRVFTPPPSPRPVATPQPPVPTPSVEPPSIKVTQAAAPPALGTTLNIPPPPVPTPQIQAQEKPKLAFETPGAQSASPSPRPSGLGKIAPPRATVDEAIRSVSKQGPGGLTIGDMPDEGLGQTLGQAPAPGRQASRVELLSDPMGVDFKPYLIRVLAAVRQNWMAVVPESARLGRRGKVVIQFSISRAGAVPKLVIAMPSGTEALDRAAVAGVSASNPFPPLPGEFKGDQIRVQLVFFYNVSTR